MRLFIKKTLIFCIPLVIFIGIPSYILLSTAESFSRIERLINSGNNYLVGYAYSEDNYKFLKLKEIENRPRQSVMTLGSSRVLEFREKMFETSFYNCGSMVKKVGDFLPFLKTLSKEKYPKYLIINLDQWMFNHNWDDFSQRDTLPIDVNTIYQSNFTARTIRSAWEDLLKNRFSVNVFYNNDESVKKIGLNAIVNNKGFRKDGSFFYGNQIDYLLANDPKADDYQFRGTFDRIDKGIQRFEKGREINPEALKEVEKILSFAKKENIFLIAILPPFADKVNEKMKQDGGYRYMEPLYGVLKPMFNNYGFELWEHTYLNTYGSDDSEVIDGFHGGEVTYLRMLIHMLENNSKLNECASVDRLKKDLKNRKNSLEVY